MGDGAVIGEGLHDRDRKPRDHGWAGERQRHPPKPCPRRAPEGAGRFQDAYGLFQKGRPHNQIDVRIKNE